MNASGMQSFTRKIRIRIRICLSTRVTLSWVSAVGAALVVRRTCERDSCVVSRQLAKPTCKPHQMFTRSLEPAFNSGSTHPLIWLRQPDCNIHHIRVFLTRI